MRIIKRLDLHVKSFNELAGYEPNNYIIVEEGAASLLNEAANVLFESKWVDSPEAGYKMRKDVPKFPHEKLHIHIAHNKHTKAKNKQVSWNVDGTRHDKMNFDDNFRGIEKAREIARKVLKIGPDIVLEWIGDIKIQTPLVNTGILPAGAMCYYFRAIKTPPNLLLS
jgi:hypothetical protein